MELVFTLARNATKPKSLDHREEQMEDGRNVGENSCNYGDGTDQMGQSLMFMMMKLKYLSLYCMHNSTFGSLT
jgi:hypothetical protein